MSSKTKLLCLILGIIFIFVCIFVVNILCASVLWIEIPPGLVIVKGIIGNIEEPIKSNKKINFIWSAEKKIWVDIKECTDYEKLFSYKMDWVESLSLNGDESIKPTINVRIPNLKILKINGKYHPVNMFHNCNEIFDLTVVNGTIKTSDLTNMNLKLLRIRNVEQLVLDKNLSNLKGLSTLLLNSTDIDTKTGESIGNHVKNLETIFLKDMQKEVIEEVLLGAKNCKYIDIAHKKGLNFDTNLFLDLIDLQEINLSKINFLEGLDISNLNNLKRVILVNSKIDFIKLPDISIESVEIELPNLLRKDFFLTKSNNTAIKYLTIETDKLNVESIANIKLNNLTVRANEVMNIDILNKLEKEIESVYIRAKIADAKEVESVRREQAGFEMYLEE